MREPGRRQVDPQSGEAGGTSTGRRGETTANSHPPKISSAPSRSGGVAKGNCEATAQDRVKIDWQQAAEPSEGAKELFRSLSGFAFKEQTEQN